MDKSENIDGLAGALAKAQAQIEGATKDKANPFFKSKYADLSSVVAAIQKPLAAVGLSYTQIIHDAENSAKVETVIMHSSGQWLSCGIISVPVTKADAQGFGSALTYARRYSLSAAFGVAPEDDDGNAAAAAKPERPFEKAHSPTDGAFDALSTEHQATAKRVANSIMDLWGEGKQFAAYELYYQGNHSNEMKLAVWEILKPHSAVRSELKKMHVQGQAKNVAATAT